MLKIKLRANQYQTGMTLLEVMVGFVIFSASLVAILDYVSNQIYLNHLTEKNQQKVSLIDEYVSSSLLDEQSQEAFFSSLTDLGLSVSSAPLDSFKDRKTELTLVETTVTVSDQGGDYEWTILELK